MRILMVGLDAAGKTTILYKLKLGEGPFFTFVGHRRFVVFHRSMLILLQPFCRLCNKYDSNDAILRLFQNHLTLFFPRRLLFLPSLILFPSQIISVVTTIPTIGMCNEQL